MNGKWEDYRTELARRYLDQYEARLSQGKKPELQKEPDRYDPNQVNELYRKIRNAERKVPSLYVYDPSSVSTFLPSLALPRDVASALETRENNGLLTVYLNGISIVSFSKEIQEHIGRKVDIQEEGLQGHIFLNSDFFQRLDLPKNKGTDSDMRNIARSYFKVNGKNHVALLQYLNPMGRSSEHYHSLEETIVQIAGKSFLVVRPVDNDTQDEHIELTPGRLYKLKPRTLHQLYTIDEGSITLPVKQTNPNKKDQFHYEKSQARIQQEIDRLLACYHESGNAILSDLQIYSNGLTHKEKKSLQSYLEILKGRNPNLDIIIQEFAKL